MRYSVGSCEARPEAWVLFRKRQHPRIAVAVDVEIHEHEHSFVAVSVEIGAGGMSLKHAERLKVSQPVQVSLALPGQNPIVIPAVVWWKRGSLLGVRFDPSDDARLQVARWVEQELQRSAV